jgi:hypothetical protein
MTTAPEMYADALTAFLLEASRTDVSEFMRSPA